jgi:hypothetical protein
VGKQGAFELGGLAASHDEEWILYPEMPSWPSELMLVEKFC